MLPPRVYVFLTLNAIRILTIISLLLVFASNIVTLADDIKAVNRFVAAGGNSNISSTNNSTSGTTNTTVQNYDYILGSTVPNQPAGVFWAVLNRLLIIFQVIVLILAEIGFPSSFFERFFPILGKNFGLGPLGLIQMLLGAAILSHDVNTFTLVSAFFLFSLGCVNVLFGLIFRESAKSKRSISSWREHGKSVLPTRVAGVEVDLKGSPPTFISNLYTGGTTSSTDSMDKHTGAEKTQDRFAGFGFGRQGEKAAGLKGYLISKPVESLPRYAPK